MLHHRLVAAGAVRGAWVTVAGPSQLSSLRWGTGIALLSCTSAAACVAVVKGPKGSPSPAVAFVTGNGGATWAESSLPADFFPRSLQCFTSGACVAAGGSWSSQGHVGTILYSTDGGATWAAAAPSAFGPAISLSCADSSDCLAFANGNTDSATENMKDIASQMLTSTDGGASWQPVDAIGLPPGFVTGLSCPDTSDCWAAGISASGTSGLQGFLASSADFGETWQHAQLPQGIAVPRDVECPTSTDCYALAIQRSAGSVSVVFLAYGN